MKVLLRVPEYVAFDDTMFEVTVMSGLPAAGNDAWIAANAEGLPVVSLDQLREELDIAPSEPRGNVIDAARSRAREFLRERSPFVWNATNLSHQLSGPLVALCADYHARVRVVYCETPFEANLRVPFVADGPVRAQ
jgi:predicted kinase